MAIYFVNDINSFFSACSLAVPGDVITITEDVSGNELQYYGYVYVPVGVTLNGNEDVLFRMTSSYTWDSSAYFYVYGTFNTNGMEIVRNYKANIIVVAENGIYNQTGRKTTYQEPGPVVYLLPGAECSFIDTNAYQIIATSSDTLSATLTLKNSTVYDLNIASECTNYSAVVEDCIFNTVILNNNYYANEVVVKNVIVHESITLGGDVIVDGLTIADGAVLQVNDLPRMYKNFSDLTFISKTPYIGFYGTVFSGITWEMKEFYGVSEYHVDGVLNIEKDGVFTAGDGTQLHFTGSDFNCYGIFSVKNAELYTDAYTSYGGFNFFAGSKFELIDSKYFCSLSSDGSISFGTDTEVVIQNTQFDAPNVCFNFYDGSTAEITGISGNFHFAFYGDVNITLRNNDFSNCHFSFGNTNRIDLSGNYWGGRTLEEIQQAFADDNCLQYVIIDSVLMSPNATSFYCENAYYSTGKKSLILTFSSDVKNNQDWTKLISIKDSATGAECKIQSATVTGKNVEIKFVSFENSEVYTVEVDPGLSSADGSFMDQNKNLVSGEAADKFSRTFDFSGSNFIISDFKVNDKINSGDTFTASVHVTPKEIYELNEKAVISVYLSTDNIFDLSDKLLASQELGKGFEAGKDVSLSFSSGDFKEGDYYLIVRADAPGQPRENNAEVEKFSHLDSVQISVSIPVIEYGKTETGVFSTSNMSDTYKLVQKAGEAVKLSLAQDGVSQVYINYGSVATSEDFVKKILVTKNEEIILPETNVDTEVYILINSKSSSSHDYTLWAEKMPLSIQSVTPEQTSINADILLEVSGTVFSRDSQIIITDASGKTSVLDTNFVSTSFLTADIKANTFLPGEYSITVTDGDSSVTYDNKIVLNSMGKADFQYELNLPANLGYHIISEIEFSYSNAGTIAMDAPLVFVTAEQNGERKAIMTMDESLLTTGFWTYNLPDGYANTVSFLATGESGSVLQPGSGEQSVSFYWAGWQQDWDFDYPPFEFKVAVINSDNTDLIDWNEVIGDSTYSPAYKALLVKALEENVGTTWGSYVKLLNENLRELQSLGMEETVSAQELFGMILENIDGSQSPVAALDSYYDVYQSCPGVDLFLARSRSVSVQEQYEKGIFGYGWKSNWECNAEKEDDGTVKIELPGGAVYTFEPSVTGDFISFSDGVTLEIINGNYQVTDKTATRYTFTAEGKLYSIQDIDGNTITAYYSGSGKLTSLAHSCGKSLRIEYNSQGFVAQATISNEAQGTIANHLKECYKYTYDKNGNLVSVYKTYDSKWLHISDGIILNLEVPESTPLYQYEYDSELVHCLVKNINATAQSEIDYTYDSYGRLTGYSEKGSDNEVSIAYGINSVTMTDQNGNSYTESFGIDGKILEATDVRGNSVRYKYDTQGNLLSATDHVGNVVSYTYDKDGNCISETDIFNQKTTYTYAGDNIKNITDSRGNTLTYTYDSKDRVIRIEDSSQNVVSITYDGRGNVSSQTDSRGITSQYTYNELGNVLSVSRNGLTLTYTYDDDGNMKSYSDLQGNKFSYSYNQDGTVSGFTDTKGNKTAYMYDEAGNVSKITYANGQSESFVTDSFGNTVSWTTMNGAQMTSTVNSQGQITQTYNAGQTVNLTYNNYGEVVSANDMTFTYDNTGNLTSVSYSDGRQVTYEYNKAGLLTQQSDEAGNVTAYSYDSFGSLDKITDKSGALVADYDFNSLGQLVRHANGNGTYTTYQYTEYGEVSKISWFDKNGSETGFTAYSYDNDGLCTEKATAEGIWAYSYDKNGRLLSEVFTNNAGTVTQSNSYTYDAMGNRLTATVNGITTTYTYNSMNQIVSANGFAYRYDNAGNLLEDEERTYTWTKDHRVASETLKSTGQTWTYGYDALGNRNSVTTNGVTTLYTVDINGNVLAEYVNGIQTRNYYQGLGLAGFATADGNYYFNSDMLGSTISVTNNDGTIVNSYTYDAFGNTLSSSETVANDFEFVGSYGLMANASGTTFVRARNYDPVTGRWISMDPSGINGGENLYEYCYNEPITKIDVNGTFPVAVAIVGSVIAVTVGGYLVEDKSSEVNKVGGPDSDVLRIYYDPDSKGTGHVAVEYDGVAASSGPGADKIRNDIRKYRDPNNKNVKHIDIQVPKNKSQAVKNKIISIREKLWATHVCTVGVENVLEELGDNYNYSLWPKKMYKELLKNYPQPNDNQFNNTGNSDATGSCDPNDMIGPAGYGEKKSVAAGSLMTYTVMCENDPEFATAPVRWLRINSVLDEAFDLNYFTIDAFYLAGNYVKLDGGLESYNQRRVMNINGTDVTLDFAINLNRETRALTIEVMAIDPTTDFMLQDPSVGFLYPNDETGIGDGYFVYTLKSKDDLANGTIITNKADIYFDFNDVIPTPEASNTIDAMAPEIDGFIVMSAGDDQVKFYFDGRDSDTGIKGYNIAYSVDGQNYTSLATVNGNLWTCTLDMSQEYFFKAQAVDNVGNISEWVDGNSFAVAGGDTPDDLIFISSKYNQKITGKKQNSVVLEWGENAFSSLEQVDDTTGKTIILSDSKNSGDYFDKGTVAGVAVIPTVKETKNSFSGKSVTTPKGTLNITSDTGSTEFIRFATVNISDGAKVGTVSGGKNTISETIKSSKNTDNVSYSKSVAASGKVTVTDAVAGDISGYSTVTLDNGRITGELVNSNEKITKSEKYVGGVLTSSTVTETYSASGTATLKNGSHVESISGFKTVKLIASTAGDIVLGSSYSETTGKARKFTYTGTVTLDNSTVDSIEGMKKVTVSKGFNTIGSYTGSAGNDTFTINKNAVLALGNVDMAGGAKDKFVNNGTLVLTGDFDRSFISGKGEIVAASDVWEKLNDETVLNLGATADGFRSTKHENSDDTIKKAVKWDLKAGDYTGWLGSWNGNFVDKKGNPYSVEGEDTVDYIKFTVSKNDVGKELSVFGVEEKNFTLYDKKGSEVDIISAAGTYTLKLELDGTESTSYTLALA